MIHEQNKLIEGLQEHLKEEEARVKTLAKRFHECSEEMQMYKEELDSIANALKEKDRQLELMEKEKADILLVQKQQAYEMNRSKKELKQEA